MKKYATLLIVFACTFVVLWLITAITGTTDIDETEPVATQSLTFADILDGAEVPEAPAPALEPAIPDTPAPAAQEADEPEEETVEEAEYDEAEAAAEEAAQPLPVPQPVAQAVSKSDFEAIFDRGYNPYDNHLPAMPDDGCRKLHINPIGGTLGKVFCDSNYKHLAAARRIGIDPVTGPASAWNLRRPIVEVRSCPSYFVDELKHSYPYLVPEAEALLRDIGDRFNAELAARGGGSYRIKVTSVLRTPATVGRLRRVNRNATETSAHQFGTTFDISYSKFICDGITVNRTQEDLKNLLAEVLDQLRREGRCYVKHERKQACFHITAR